MDAVSWHHIDPSEGDIPDIEIWPDYPVKIECPECGIFIGAEDVVNAIAPPVCPSCERKAQVLSITYDYKYFYWYCIPGCLPSSDCFGPYDSEGEALSAAREFADVS